MGPVQRRLLGDLARVKPQTTPDCPLQRLPMPSVCDMQEEACLGATGHKHERRLHVREVPLPSVCLGRTDPADAKLQDVGEAHAKVVLPQLPQGRTLCHSTTSRYGAELQRVANCDASGQSQHGGAGFVSVRVGCTFKHLSNSDAHSTAEMAHHDEHHLYHMYHSAVRPQHLGTMVG